MAGEPAFFELGVGDAEQARAFYGALFGWQLAPGPSGEGPSGGFTIGTPGIRGGLHGGDPGGGPYLFFAVDDMATALDRVRELGGTVEEMDVEGDDDAQAEFGRFTLCRDDQGSPFGLHQRPSGALADN